ncbi:MAG: hypothetical protein JST50_01450 [Bacteroidetes bacterium]|jgi:hypothetical protein|nr:hypothetical protein [Bacteroidota bacterium]
MHSIIALTFTMLIIYWLVVFFKKPAINRPCTVMEGLTLKKIVVVYPVNAYRPKTIIKEWNVAVKTTEPGERFEEHSGWMMYILIEHTHTIRIIALLEHIEKENLVRHYNAAGTLNRKVIKHQTVNGHEA